jgi:F0F1-type ATP synthase assembly protein I
MSREDEVERIRRIRDRQIQARDPQIKQNKLQKNISKRRRSRVESFDITRLFTDLPKLITGTLIGLLIGLLVLVILPYIVKTDWVDYLSIGILVVTTFMGAAFGRAIDARDNLRDF